MSYSRVNGPVGTFSSPLLFVLTAAVYYLLTVSATSTISVNESPTLLRTNYSSPSAELTENKSLMVVQENYGHQKQEDLFIGFLAGYSHSKVFLGALPLAIELVNRNPLLLPGFQLKYRAVDIGRNYSVLPIRSMTEMRDNGVVAFVGPDNRCTPEALVASAWNLPMISYIRLEHVPKWMLMRSNGFRMKFLWIIGLFPLLFLEFVQQCADTAVSDKNIFHTFARTLPPASKVSKSVVSLLMAFNWHKFAIVTASRPAWVSETAKAIKVLAESKKLHITSLHEYGEYVPIPSHLNEMHRIVEETYKTTRIYVFVGEHIATVDFVRCLQNKNLLQTGEYVVVSVDDEIYDPLQRVKFMDRVYFDRYLNRVKKRSLEVESLQSLLKITPTLSANLNYSIMREQMKEYTQKYFNVPFHIAFMKNISVPIYGAHLYDAIMIYARAATEILASGGNLSDGVAVMEHIFNRTYSSIQGFEVYIDSNGDAEGNYTLIAMHDDYHYPGGKKMTMQPVGHFIYNATNTDVPEFRYINSYRTIKWLNGRIPLAEPICGFFNEKCKPRTSDWRYITSSVFVTLFVAVAGAFLVKHYRYEQTLACLLWKVELKDVKIICTEPPESGFTNKNIIAVRPHSIVQAQQDNSKRAFTTIGLYRGNIVAVKKIHKRSVDITRSIRKELKQMRELRHENVISFIGASIETNSVAILTSYCARGSLYDVLNNSDLYLDHMFVSSLISDILKGLIYLHDSDIVSHGNLRSTNCLVDSRWVCQISDFGLNEFRSGQEEPNKTEMELMRSLWRAPELLREPNESSRGTQKGDVYSFGIILYEVINRKGPWGDLNLSPEEIVMRVKKFPVNGISFRPSIRYLDIPEYVRQCLRLCWEEDPEIRPDIRLVRVKLKEMQAGLKPNIFDNMLAIMEKYAYNLEGIVQERTNQLSEEKKKTEALLLRMLPKSVADSLKGGEPVQAECYDCVTIYFSDLVGFTELCAISTPLEVVEMLNDLYTCCDSIITNYDVYKVETIGDAYMVASGLPQRNGAQHAGEIASMALHILNRISQLEIRHRPGELLQLRIGIHSGQCVAGVVGLQMPRYCLFGDTVNTASRMESCGLASKIHISQATFELLKTLGGYHCEERGVVQIKGKGEMRTYWLVSEEPNLRKIDRNERDAFHIVPDLICDSEPDGPTADVAKESYVHSPRKRMRMSYTSILNYKPSQNRMQPSIKVTAANSSCDFDRAHPHGVAAGNYCTYCLKRRRIAEESHLTGSEAFQLFDSDLILEQRFPNGGGFNEEVKKGEGVTLSNCTCYYMTNSHLRRDSYIHHIRTPRSAPHISFMQ